jgi:hypothetical protein
LIDGVSPNPRVKTSLPPIHLESNKKIEHDGLEKKEKTGRKELAHRRVDNRIFVGNRKMYY